MVAAFDASKAVLEMSHFSSISRVENRLEPIIDALSKLPSSCVIAVESTSKYHRLLADTAYARGFKVFVANPKKVHAYRKSEPVRGKTDRLDAQVLENYVLDKQDRLHPYRPSDSFSEALRDLTRRRETLVEAKTQALSSLADSFLLKDQRQALKESFDEALQAIEDQIAELLKQSEKADLLLKVPGFGSLVVGGLLGLLDRYEFKSADAFVAYLGLDPRPDDSGTRRGARFLSCDGDSCVRRLLYNAAMSGCRCKAWKPYYALQKAKGLSSTESILILARKMARAAWSIHKYHTPFEAERIDKRP